MSGMIYPTQLYRDYFHKPLYIRIPSLNNQDDSWKVRDPVFFSWLRWHWGSPPLGHPPLKNPFKRWEPPKFQAWSVDKVPWNWDDGLFVSWSWVGADLRVPEKLRYFFSVQGWWYSNHIANLRQVRFARNVRLQKGWICFKAHLSICLGGGFE